MPSATEPVMVPSWWTAAVIAEDVVGCERDWAMLLTLCS